MGSREAHLYNVAPDLYRREAAEGVPEGRLYKQGAGLYKQAPGSGHGGPVYITRAFVYISGASYTAGFTPIVA